MLRKLAFKSEALSRNAWPQIVAILALYLFIFHTATKRAKNGKRLAHLNTDLEGKSFQTATKSNPWIILGYVQQQNMFIIKSWIELREILVRIPAVLISEWELQSWPPKRLATRQNLSSFGKITFKYVTSIRNVSWTNEDISSEEGRRRANRKRHSHLAKSTTAVK